MTQIKNKINNLYAKAKKKNQEYRKYQKALKKTGNHEPPTPPAEMTAAEKAVHDLLADSPSFNGLVSSDEETEVVGDQEAMNGK